MGVTVFPTNTTRVISGSNQGGSTKGKSKKNGGDPHAAWLTRKQATDLLGCSENTLLNKERAGKVTAVKGVRIVSGIERSVWLYNPDELAKLPRRNEIDNPGERAARAFELFNEGHTDRHIVVELRETPDWVRDHRVSWLDGGGAEMVITPDAHVELAKLVGAFNGVADLVTSVKRLVAATPPREIPSAKED